LIDGWDGNVDMRPMSERIVVWRRDLLALDRNHTLPGVVLQLMDEITRLEATCAELRGSVQRLNQKLVKADEELDQAHIELDEVNAHRWNEPFDGHGVYLEDGRRHGW
jgi:hypothetical protein